MAGWMGHVGFHLEPLADRLFQLVRDGDRIFADETTLPVLGTGRGRTRTGDLWTYLKTIVPVAERDRRSWPTASKLAAPPDASNGILRAGGALSSATAMPPIASSPIPIGRRTADARLRWAHLRRQFCKLHDAVSQTATWTIERMVDLGTIEARVGGCDAQSWLDARRATSAPIVDELHVHWESELTRISGKSKLAEAI
jgi:transposase